jgi:hypothetical protein
VRDERRFPVIRLLKIWAVETAVGYLWIKVAEIFVLSTLIICCRWFAPWFWGAWLYPRLQALMWCAWRHRVIVIVSYLLLVVFSKGVGYVMMRWWKSTRGKT